MAIQITGRHMEITEAIRDYVQKKVGKLDRFYDRISDVEVVLEPDGKDHRIELIVRADHHSPFVVHHSEEDLYACLDSVIDKIKQQLSRHKDKARHRKGRISFAGPTDPAKTMGPEPDAE